MYKKSIRSIFAVTTGLVAAASMAFLAASPTAFAASHAADGDTVMKDGARGNSKMSHDDKMAKKGAMKEFMNSLTSEQREQFKMIMKSRAKKMKHMKKRRGSMHHQGGHHHHHHSHHSHDSHGHMMGHMDGHMKGMMKDGKMMKDGEMMDDTMTAPKM